MPYFLVYYVVNTLSTFTVGSYLFAYYNQQHVGKGIQWSRIFSPPLIAFLGSMIWVWFGGTIPTFLNQSLIYIGNLVTPLSLMYIGIHLAQVGLRSLTFDRDMNVSILGRFCIVSSNSVNCPSGNDAIVFSRITNEITRNVLPSINNSYIGHYAIISNGGKC